MMIGKYVVVRSNRAGVFAGVLAAKEGAMVTLTGCRKLWYWAGASDTLQIAKEGVKRPGSCKFTVTVDSIQIQDAIEVIPTTAEAEASIKAVPVWKM